MVQCALDIVDSSIGHAAPLKDLQPFLGGLLLRCRLYQTIDLFSVLNSIAICREASICLPLREPQSIRQYSEQLIIAASEENVAVKGIVASVGYNGSFQTVSSLAF